MTTPSRAAADQFAIVPLHDHRSAPADAIVTGPLDIVMEWLPDTQARNDAIEQAARAAEDAVEAERLQGMAKASTVRMITDTIAHVADRMDAFEAQRAERVRRDAEREAEEEAKRIADELARLPDPDNPATHQPGGELHVLAPKGEPATGDAGNVLDQAGDPAKGELEPPEPEAPEVKGVVYPPPTAISLW